MVWQVQISRHWVDAEPSIVLQSRLNRHHIDHFPAAILFCWAIVETSLLDQHGFVVIVDSPAESSRSQPLPNADLLPGLVRYEGRPRDA